MTGIKKNNAQEREVVIPEKAPEAFHLLAKPTGAICNLDCAYCFFLDKEVFYPGSKFRMSDELLEQYIKQLIEDGTGRETRPAWNDFSEHHADQWHTA